MATKVYNLPGMESKDSQLNASLFSVSFIVLSTVIVTLAITINGLLPEPLNTKDVPAKSQKFIAERAYSILEELSSIGPKVIGTYENEVLAVEVIKNKINKVIEETLNPINTILLDQQTVSGCFNLTIKNIAKSLCYQDVQNIVVKLQSPKATESILLNCHFDSVPTSPGASDNGLHCSVLLELLRVLANSNKPLKRSVIFLFNGAEEGGLLGSHGFVTKHRWMEDIVTFVNLDACGAGGREILFQTGPRAYVLPKIYAQSVPYPHGAVFGEELFQTGVLPSDTDFRIFRDFGHLKGLDLAHYKNGYVYHTSSDNISYISRNVIQHSGDNLLALSRALIQYDNLKEAIFETNDQAIYLDVFGKFMIYYSTTVAYFINIFTIFLSVYSSGIIVIKIFKGMRIRYIYYHFMVNFLFMGIGRFVVLVALSLLAYLLERNNMSMLWYSNQWFVASYYGVAALYLTTTLLKIRQRFIPSNLNAEAESDLFIIIIQMINTFFLFIGTVLRIRSIFVFAVGLIPISISHIVLNKTNLKYESVSKKTFVYTLYNFIPSLYATYLYLQITELLIPMMGRIGSSFNSEMVMWVLCEFFIYFIFSYMEPLVLLVKNWWKVQLTFGVVFIAYVVAILFGDFLSPFADETPQRFIAVHVNRKFAHAESVSKIETNGFIVVPLDQQGPSSISKLFKYENFQPIGKEICQKELFCGVPPVAPFVLRYGDSLYWKESEKTIFPQDKDVTCKIVDTDGFKTFHINMTDSGFVDIIILPMNGAELVEWSLFPDKPNPTLKWLNNTTYMIRRYRGLPNSIYWSFSVKFDISKMWNSSSTFKLAVSVYHLPRNNDQYSPKFRRIVETFPSWTRYVAWLIDYEEYLF